MHEQTHIYIYIYKLRFDPTKEKPNALSSAKVYLYFRGNKYYKLNISLLVWTFDQSERTF